MTGQTGFRPSAHGFAFPNAWRDTVLGIIASRGRCGGMVFTALDYFQAGQPMPSVGAPGELPAHDSALARLIWRRQMASLLGGLGHNLRRFVSMTYRTAAGPRGVARLTLCEVESLLATLDAGQPVPLGLLSAISLRHIARNHQVLAYGVQSSGDQSDDRLLVRIYDPNFPRRDDIVLDVALDGGGPVLERVGDRSIPWRGFFVERYRPLRRLRAGEPMTERAPDTRFMLGMGVIGALVGLAGWLLVSRKRRRPQGRAPR